MSIQKDAAKRVREAADIVRVVGHAVSLRKQGQRYTGLCPFHAEKTPSFSVSGDKGLYHCFGCHAGGDVIDFVMRHRGMSFPEAVRALGQEFGVEVGTLSPAEAKRRDELNQLARINALAQTFFVRALWSEAGAPAKRYLESRGIPAQQAKSAQLGYGGPSGALLAFLAQKGVSPQDAGRAGLLTEDGRRCLFDERLIFPVHDAQGRACGFGGRRLDGEKAAKYVNSRESTLFAKRKVLYGWHEAQQAMVRSRRVVVVEGFLDVLACHRAGISEAVAALGTAFTDDHAALAARLATEATVMLDADAAGQRASRDVTERLIRAKLKTFVAPVAAGEDPDSMLQKRGPQALAAVMAQATPAVEHFMSLAFAPGSPGGVEDKAAAARDLWSLITAFGPGLERDLYVARLAEHVGVSPQHLESRMRAPHQQETPRPAKPETTDRAPREPPPPPPATLDIPCLEMLGQLLIFPELRPRLLELAEYAPTQEVCQLFEQLADPERDLAATLSECGAPPRWVTKLAAVRPWSTAEDPGATDDPALLANRTFEDVLLRLKHRHVDAAHRAMIRDLAAAQADGRDTFELERRLRDLTRRLRALRPRRGHGDPLHERSSNELREE